MGTKEVVISVGYSEFNNEVLRFLKQHSVPVDEYDIVCEEELSNDTEKSFTVTGKLDDSFYKYTLPKLLKGDTRYNTDPILDWMCHCGVIESGKYVVSVSW
jgi:hypothetical protein